MKTKKIILIAVAVIAVVGIGIWFFTGSPAKHKVTYATVAVSKADISNSVTATGTMLTRFLPFLIFRENRKTPEVIQYIGKYLPAAVFGMLVVYCLRNVSIVSGSHGLPELIATELYLKRLIVEIGRAHV